MQLRRHFSIVPSRGSGHAGRGLLALVMIFSAATGFGILAVPGTASASVDAPPTAAVIFGSSTAIPGSSANLVVMVTNPATNPDSLTGVGFTDTLPSGWGIVTEGDEPGGPPATPTCGETVQIQATPARFWLSRAAIAPGPTCTVSVIAKIGASEGVYTDSSGPITTDQGVTGASAEGTLTVSSAPVVTTAVATSTITPVGQAVQTQ